MEPERGGARGNGGPGVLADVVVSAVMDSDIDRRGSVCLPAAYPGRRAGDGAASSLLGAVNRLAGERAAENCRGAPRFSGADAVDHQESGDDESERAGGSPARRGRNGRNGG